MRKLNNKGFTLVEIMIVVAIIVLLAAIAIPNLLRARLNANEASAIASMRTISTAAESFRAAQSPPQYPATLGALSDTTGGVPPYIDSVLGGGTKQGYTFTYASAADASGRRNTFSVVAAPVVGGTTGIRSFFVDHSGVVRVGTTDQGTPIE